MTISISISISIFFKSVDISTIDMSYRYIKQGYTAMHILKRPLCRVKSSPEPANSEESRAFAISGNFSGVFEELEERIKEMMERSENRHEGQGNLTLCKVCGKEAKARDIKDHIESKHLEGIVLPCNSSEKIFRTRNAL